MKKKSKTLPKLIYVIREGEPPDDFMSVQGTPLGIEHGTQVGIYRLDAVKTQKVTEELV